MVIDKKSLSRRTFLRGAGVAVALPFLDAMVPALTAATKLPSTRRLGFVYTPNGVLQRLWEPAVPRPELEITPILAPLKSLQENLVLVSGLAHRQADSFGEGVGDHTRAIAVWLTGVHAYQLRGQTERHLDVTADQIAAREFAQATVLPSLELSLESPNKISCDNGDCFYGSTLSWRNGNTPNPMEGDPRVVFDRLFGETSDPIERRAETREKGSILDSVLQEVYALNQTLGRGDRNQVNEYLDAVREIEQRLDAFERRSSQYTFELPGRPLEVPDNFEEYAKLMFDLQVVAFQADITRVFTLLMGQEASVRTYPNIGVPDQHHPISHHREREELMAKKAKIDTYHVQLFGHFLERLRSTPDGDGSLLDHSLILYGSGLGDGNLHDHANLPALLVGGKDTLRGGRHLQSPPDTPMANLLLAMLDKVGVPTPDKIGDSTAHLSGV